MKIALVTGASSGMGAEFVRQISADGLADEIWAVARRKDRPDGLAREIKTPLYSLALDLTKGEDVAALHKELELKKPQVFIAVNCAGFAKFGSYEDVRAEDELAMIDLNIRALTEVSRMVLPYMREPAHLIQISSTSAFQPLPYMNVYAAGKAFVLNYSRALAFELQSKGVSVTAVCPGWTSTEFFDVAEENASSSSVGNFLFMSKPEKVVKRAIKDALNGREMSVYGVTNKLHLFFSKIIPASLIMRIWNMVK